MREAHAATLGSEAAADLLGLAMHVPAFHPGYRFQYVPRPTTPAGLIPSVREACEDYLRGLAEIRHRPGACLPAVRWQAVWARYPNPQGP